MNRTKTLVCIVILLCFSIIFYIFCVKFDEICEYLADKIQDYARGEIIIPETKLYSKEYEFRTVNKTMNFIPMNKDDLRDIYYTVLNNGWESFTFYCPREYVGCAEDVKNLANESEFITTINNYVSPYNSYKKYNTLIIGEDEILLTVEKLYSKEEIELLKTEVNLVLNALEIDKNNIVQKDIRKIHDYLIKTVSYDDNYVEGESVTLSNKANGALIDNIALCSGYTDAFALFMDELGIENFKVSTENHVWNVIYFNEQWLHVDVTWDDDEVNNKTTHYFFLIDTEELLEKDKTDHSFNQELYLELK